MVKKKNTNLYDEILNKIKGDTADFPVHTRIPTRMEMAANYGVTRTTIEKAISQLVGEGYLYSRDGSGTYIAEKKNGHNNFNRNSIDSWGVILPNIVSDTYPEIFRGIEDFARQKNINVVLCNTDNNIGTQGHYIEKLVESNVSGIIIVPALRGSPDFDSFRFLADNKIPFVFCNRKVENINAPQVISNNFYGSLIATQHLVNIGYKRIAFVAPSSYSHVEHRLQGYLACLHMSGHQITDEYIFIDDGRSGAEQDLAGSLAVEALYNSGIEKPDAFFCFNDRTAHGVYRAIEEKGLEIGKDVGLVGYDDSAVCSMLPVKLTSVRYPKYETGSTASEVLYEIINGRQYRENYTIVLNPSLTVRQSCGSGFNGQ